MLKTIAEDIRIGDKLYAVGPQGAGYPDPNSYWHVDTVEWGHLTVSAVYVDGVSVHVGVTDDAVYQAFKTYRESLGQSVPIPEEFFFGRDQAAFVELRNVLVDRLVVKFSDGRSQVFVREI